MQGEAVDEHNSLAFAATGAARDPGVHGKPEPLNFFHLKGDIEQLLAAFDSSDVTFDRTVPAWLHPGRAARVQLADKTLAISASFIPEIAAARKLKQDVFVAEVFVEALTRSRCGNPPTRLFQSTRRWSATSRSSCPRAWSSPASASSSPRSASPNSP